MSLVPIASMGDLFGVPCPTIKSIIHLVNLLHECDYWQTGRTAEKMGLTGLNMKQIRRFIQDGEPVSKRGR